MRLTGKVAVVTGAGSGFGEGIAVRFAEEGAKVVVADIDGDAAARVANTIGGMAVRADVTCSEDVAAMIAAAAENYGGLDVLVNNAGVPQRAQPADQVDEALFDRIFAVNVKGLYFGVVHALPALRQRGGGCIINTGSTAAVRPRPGLAWYSASKGAVVTATKALALELAPFGIRVNAINPVAGDTPMLKEFMGDGEAARQQFVASIPLGRLSTPRDIANAALYLASDEASLVTGLCMEIDGGRCV